MASCSFVVVSLFVLGGLAEDLPRLRIPQGELRGKYDVTFGGRRFMTFNGIPYAQPPIGERRFEEPVPATEWIGVLDATENPPMCLQYNHMGYIVEGLEDCLYLNIHTPEIRKGSSLMDVIVYIHGGAFMFFTSSAHGAHYLLDKDLVLVTVSYRLGPLGFLSTEDSNLPGNNGLKDQTLALKWVKENIKYFGGNPDSITIGGMSAGGASVHFHMLSPLSRGLFNRAISVSGTALCPWTIAENIKEKTQAFAEALGCPTADSAQLKACLKNRNAARIVAYSKELMPWLYNPFSPIGPVVEPESPSAFISEHPRDIIEKGKAANVPWIVSRTTEEGLYPGAEFLEESKFEELMKNWDHYIPHVLDYYHTLPHISESKNINQKIKQFYSTENEWSRKNMIKMMSDRLFDVCVESAALLHAKHYDAPIYPYIFSYRGETSLSDYFVGERVDHGVSHADDVGYVLKMGIINIQSNEDVQMMNAMVGMWESFARTGTPMFIRKGIWTPLKKDLPRFSYLNITSPSDAIMGIKEDFSNHRFWKSLGLKENIPDVNEDAHDEL